MNEKYKYLVDSNIIIYHLNGEQTASYFLQQHHLQICISRLTFIEVLSFDFSEDERRRVISLLEAFEIIDTNNEIALQAIKNRQNRKIKLADNIIASTAQVNRLLLVTRNIKDFNRIDVELLNPFEES